MDYPEFPGMWDQTSRQMSDVAPEYPFSNVTQTKSGHVWLLDDTPGSEVIRLQHTSGTFFEMHTNGGHTLKVMGNNYTAIVGKNTIDVKGDCIINVNGNVNMMVNGTMNQNIKQDYNINVEGDYNIKINGQKTETLAKDPKMALHGALGAYKFIAQGGLELKGDLTVSGSIRGASVYSDGAVTAGTGIHAGVLGSTNPTAGISTLGSIYAGFPSGMGMVGYVLATAQVAAPFVFGAIVSDIQGTMLGMRIVYNAHLHQNGNMGSPTLPALASGFPMVV